MLLKVALRAVPNQQITFGANGQTFNMTVTSGTVNDKALQGENADTDDNTKIYTFATIYSGTTPIIQNTICNHAEYLNQYSSIMQGYLFFYVNGGTDAGANDQVIYTGFNSSINLYYSDYDALALDYDAWVATNKIALEQRFIFNVGS